MGTRNPMKKKADRPEPIVKLLWSVEAALATGKTVEEACRERGGGRQQLPPLTQPVWRHADRRDEAAQGAGKGERAAQADLAS
jgi:hypothetical protein